MTSSRKAYPTYITCVEPEATIAEAARFVRLLDAVTPAPKADNRHLWRSGMMRRGGPLTRVG